MAGVSMQLGKLKSSGTPRKASLQSRLWLNSSHRAVNAKQDDLRSDAIAECLVTTVLSVVGIRNNRRPSAEAKSSSSDLDEFDTDN